MFSHVELEAQADLLLRPFRGRRSGIFSERQLARRSRREVSGDGLPEYVTARASQELDDMRRSDLLTLGRMAGLSGAAWDVWSLLVRFGLSQEEIAEACGLRQPTVAYHLRRSRERVLRAMRHYRWYGLWEVYWELVNRVRK
ncbi:MAG: sigma factor-like helix-turn-helix DNA-binding protein [Armatimonadota bacterium]